MNIIKIDKIEELIINIRNEKVILDSDVAKIYGVETKRINEAIKNNPDKFPEGYIMDLSDESWEFLRSKFSTLKKGGRGEHKKYKPTALPERGLYMIATILKSKQATEATIAIIEAFTKLRTLSKSMQELSQTSDKEIQKTIMEKASELMGDLIYGDMEISESETSIEVNFAVMKMKHTIKKVKK
ncbi:MAG: ORF6N domain-containing protein [Nitrospinae bacterium]|nr:ORF6N domain-containing protein [Nitrospinota bacterium]